MNSLWLTLIIAGLLTFATRLSFILILEKWQPPRLFQRSLRFVPLAALCAIIFPELLVKNGALLLPPDLPRLAGAASAALVAWFSKNIFLTIGAGMLVFYLLRFILG
ncbi:MAG: AzlD domain-containing protein [Anaerolineaceae bacterium]